MVGVDWVVVAGIATVATVIVGLVALLKRSIRGSANAGKPERASPVVAAPGAVLAAAGTPDLGWSPSPSIVPNDAVSPMGNAVVLTMTCEPLPSSEGFSREVRLIGERGVYTWTRGNKESGHYEHWEMKLDGKAAFIIVGEYIEGTPNLKPVSFTGKIEGSIFSGQGVRGPRKAVVKGGPA